MLNAMLLLAGLIMGSLGHRSLQPTRQTAKVTYLFRLDRADSVAPVLDVRMVTQGSASGTTEFIVPSSWAGQDSLRNAITELEVAPPATIQRDSGGRLVVIHPSSASVTIHYRLHQDWSGPIRVPLYHRVVLDSSYLILNGQNGLITPSREEGAPIELHVEWSGLPASWTIITSFGSTARTVTRTTGHDLVNASFIAGRFRILDRGDGPSHLIVATDGRWHFADSAYVRLQRTVWNLERRFWNDDPFAHGFVVLVPAIQRGTVGGTAFTAGFVEFADTASALPVVVRIAAHEMLHFWNGQRIHTPEPEGRYKWFTEGFTDYYADRFFRDAGGSSDSAYLVQANRTLKDYYTSRVSGSTRVDVESRYWTDADMKFYPYRQGYAIALFLQSELTRRSNGKFDFDSLMKRTYRAALGAGGLVTDSLVLASLPSTLRSSVASAIASYIDRGERIPQQSGAIGRCSVVASINMFAFDIGFDASASTRDKIVRGVVTGGPADQAGVRDGMALTGWGWSNGDPTRNATLRVTQDGAQRTLTFLPQSGSAVAVPQFARDTSAPGCGSR